MKKITILGLLVCSLTLAGCSSKGKSDTTKSSEVKLEKSNKKENIYQIANKLKLDKIKESDNEAKRKELTESNVEKLSLANYIQVIETKTKSRDEVRAMFDPKGIKIKFVKKVNWYEMGGAAVAKDMCWTASGGLNFDKYIDDLYTDHSKQWAKSGDTIIVPYADKDYPAEKETE